MYRSFKKNPFTLYTYVLAKALQNCTKFRYTKAGFKNYRNLNNFRQEVESPKSWNLIVFCPKKYIPSAKVDLSNITFNYLCVDSPNYLCHFRNHKSFFTTQILCIFLAQTLHTFYKSSPSKCKFSDFPLLRLKFTKFFMSFFKLKVSFSSKFRSFFSIMRDNSSVLFRLTFYVLLAKVVHQRANFQTCHCLH